MNWTDGRPMVVTERDLTLPWAGGKNGSRFRCRLCGFKFRVGDTARFVFANFSDSPSKQGNFFVCVACDGSDVLERAAAQEQEAKVRFWWLRSEE